MIKIFFFSLIILSFASCSFKTSPNEWQYKSSNAFNSYIKNFLQSNDGLAKNDLSRAVKHAKKSADLTSLARIYLGECALNISVGKKDTCHKYKEISELIDDNSIDEYYSFITSPINTKEVNLLPSAYRDFALHVKRSEFSKANSDILDMHQTTSMILAAALIKDNIDDKTIDKVIETASFHGYKKVVLFWLNEKIKRTEETTEKDKISKKIHVLESSN